MDPRNPQAVIDEAIERDVDFTIEQKHNAMDAVQVDWEVADYQRRDHD